MELENPFLPGTAFKDLNKGDPLPDAPDFLAIRLKNLLAFVPQLLDKNLQGLDAVVDNEKQLEMVGRLRQLEHLCLSFYKLKSMAALRGLTRLRTLRIFPLNGNTLDGIEVLQSLKHLAIYHAPKLRSLAPIGQLANLVSLSISTPASWDVSRKTIKVASYKELAALGNLQRLDLAGVEALDKDLSPLGRLKQLKQLHFSHVFCFAIEDYASLAAKLPHTVGDCLQPTFEMNFPYLCTKCKKTNVVWLTGSAPKQKRYYCPVCDKQKLAAHIERFAELKAAAK